MLSVRFEPPAAKYIKKLKDKKLKTLYREAIDKICNDYTIGEAKTGDLGDIIILDMTFIIIRQIMNWHIRLNELGKNW